MATRLLYTILICLFPLGSRAQEYKIGDLVFNTYGEKGIVFWLHPDGTEGWAVALQDIPAPNGWGPMEDIPGLVNYIFALDQFTADTSGYTNTKILRDYLGPGNTYPAQVIDFDRGWYIPAKEQLVILGTALPFIVEQSIIDHGGVPMPDRDYFSSSEESENVVYTYDNYYFSYSYMNKGNSGSVRPIFTFKTSSFDPSLTYSWNTGHTDPVITQQPTETITYTVEATSLAGCVATAGKQIFVADGSEQTILAQICKGEVYRENGFEESEAGSYTHILPGPGGCDVTVKLELTVGEPDTTRLPPVTICEGERYTEYNFDLSEPGEYIQRWQRPGGCDSVVILNLSVTPLFQEVLYDTVCYGEAYRENGFNLSQVTAPATHYFTRSASVGCDTSVMLHLAVNPVLRTTIFDTLRFGKSYSGNGFHVTNAIRDGVYTNVEVSSCLCDSVATLYLAVQTYKNDTILYDTLCAGEPYDRYGFHLPKIEADTTLSDTLVNRSGLDSVIYLEITVLHATKREFRDTIGYGGDYNDHGFALYNVVRDSVYRDTVRSVSGTVCDSIITTLTLKVVRDTLVEFYATVCPGSGYSGHGFTLPSLFADKDTSKIIPLTSFRDSIVTLYITVSPVYTFDTDTTVCPGEQVMFRGRVLNRPGVYADSLLTAAGCDSVYRLTLRWFPVWEQRDTLALCPGDTLRWYGQMITAPGTYTETFSSVHGCDSMECVVVYPALRFDGTLDVVLDDCETYTYLFTAGDGLNDVGRNPTYRWEFGDGNGSDEEAPLYSYADSGFYPVTLRVIPHNGCDTTLSGGVKVEYYPAALGLYSDRTTATGENPEVRFWTDEFDGMSYEWDFGDGSRGTGAEVTHRYDVSTPQSYTVRLEVTNGAACVVERDVTILAEPRRTEEYLFPALFTPNGDGINDMWVIQGLWQAPENTLEIFNRKEQRVYRVSPYRNDWDGTMEDGSILPAGHYVYRLTIGKQHHTGMISIIRN